MKKFIKPILTAALLGLLVPATSALADDTDIYMANTDVLNNPNILILLDNSANWAAANQGWPVGKQGMSELESLRLATDGLSGNVNIGLMMFTSGAVDGAYIRFHVRPMWTNTRNAWKEMIGLYDCPVAPIIVPDSYINSLNGTPNCIYRNFNTPDEKINTASTDYSAAMFDVFKYFGGYTSPALAFDDLPGTPTNSTHFGKAHYATLPPDVTISGTAVHKYDKDAYSLDLVRFNPPLATVNSCAQNYLVLIGNGYPTQDSPASLLTGVGGDATQQIAPDFITVNGDIQTKLNSAPQTFASQAACELAAATTYGSAYDSYSCLSSSATATTVTLGTSSCGQYVDEAACVAAAPTIYPGYDNYSCAAAASCPGTSTLGGAPSACGLYADVASCEAALPALYPGFSSLTCTPSASTCTPSTVQKNWGGAGGGFSAGIHATAADCEAAAAIKYPGYSSYTCTVKATYLTDLGVTSCYATKAECDIASAALFPGYSSVSCATPVACNALKTVCAGASAYNSTSSCDTVSAFFFSASPYAPFTSYTCNSSNDAICPSSEKLWTLTGISGKSRYTATGTGTSWNVFATTAAGVRFDMTGSGGSTYITTTTTSQTLWDTYGNNNITTAFPTGTFTSISANYADEWAKFLQETDVNSAPGRQTIKTYTIDVFKDQQDTDQTRLLMSMARQGGGKYYTATNADAITKALQEIFAEIQSVNSVFASSSLPVSVNTQGTYLNQVFMGMFRPKSDATPRWAGNLKQYQFKIFGGILRLADKMGDEAISATTGFITPCADSFWSTDTKQYWKYSGTNATGNCKAQLSVSGINSYWSDAPDGDIVEKGGVAHRMRGATLSGTNLVTSTNYTTRNLLTCDGATTTSCIMFTDFNSSNATLTSTAFGIPAIAPSSYQSTFIDWVRGRDVDDERSNSVLNEVRPSVHGGVVHSQPAVVDYGDTTGVIAFYGSDDGVFHAIDGGNTDAEGTELWGFIAPEHYKKLHRLRDNGQTTPRIDLPGVTVSVAPKDYGFDGGIGVYQKAGTVWIFPAMRRGGRAIYAFDVSVPASPLIKWRKGCFTNSVADDSKCSASWSSIGQTWSKPTVSYIRGYSKPVLIFGGGYDTCEDTDSQTRCTGPRKGANIWFVDADTGNIIAIYPTNYSAPGDITTVTDDAGKTTHVYAADTGGYVYRINVGTYDGVTAPSMATGWSSNSTATGITIAYLSEAGQARKFLNGPAVVSYIGFNAVLIGSGDREHPLINSYACNNGASGVTNQFYMLIDKPDAYLGTPALATDLVDVTASSSTTLDVVSGVLTNDSGATSTLGWKFNLILCEQSVNKGLVIGGVAYFGTNTPATSASACETNLGVARGYAVDFLTGNPVDNAPRNAVFTGGGMPPSPVAGVVDIDGLKQPFCIGCIDTSLTANSALQGSPVTINPVGSRLRTYWYIEND